MKIAYICADMGIPVLGNKGASVYSWRAVVQHVIVRTLSMEPNA
jgi:hypothetical protein